MDESMELLEYIYENTDMGIKSTTKLINLLKEKENKIKSILEEQLKMYEKYHKESKTLLEKNKIEPKSKGLMANLTADIAMNIEVMKDNSDSKIADILTRGFRIEKIDIEKRLNALKKESDKKIVSLAEELVKFNDNSIEELKQYL